MYQPNFILYEPEPEEPEHEPQANCNCKPEEPQAYIEHSRKVPVARRGVLWRDVVWAAYADMLHDTERNQLYYIALRDAIEIMHQRGKKADVLDIGTGTGLLSMMAVKCGADSVTAVEVFEPMANCASQVIEANGMASKIKLIRKRSTEVTVGPDGDMAERANILVTEVFDTELIGEGAISTFHHAHQTLLQKDCIVVPSAANMYVQVVSSGYVRRWNNFLPLKLGIDVPPEIVRCPGAVAVHDLQLDQLSPSKFTPLTDPIKVFRFDYSGQSETKFGGKSEWPHRALHPGNCDAVFMWWDLEMDMKGKIILSCAPRWAHPTPKMMQWRDHWMQAIYYPQSSVSVEKGEEFIVHANHDEYSLWFDVTKKGCENEAASEPPACTCGAHVACSRPRVGLMNETDRNQKFITALSKVITEESICLSISDGSLLPLIAAKLGAKHVYAIESERMSLEMVKSYVHHNELAEQVTVIHKKAEHLTSSDLDGQKPTVLLSEPYFYTSMVPWHNIHFWYARTELTELLAENASILPCCATMRAIGVDFKDLWKIRAPVNNCEGFDISIFDKIIEDSSGVADNVVEPQPLWEYPGKPMTDPFSLLHFDFTKKISELRTVNRKGYIGINRSGTCNGVAIWVDFHFGNKTIIGTGLTAPPQPEENLQWEANHRQGVHLLKLPEKINLEKGDKGKLRYFVTFKPSTGDFEFYFAIAR